ncbi:MAG TPA: DHA2 family efflux MFS transporter permease subunit [Streptosporangiaceae bacterium]|jgi:EmrB/QacA subfamily drug resistance transporter
MSSLVHHNSGTRPATADPAAGAASVAVPARRPAPRLDRHLIAVSLAVVLGAIMSTLDVTVVNVAIGTLAREFRASLPMIQWVSAGYTLGLAMMVPVTGWAQARFGSKRLFLLSIALFVAGSALAGAAWSAWSLIAFRVVQGLGGGMLTPAGMTVLTRAAGSERIGRVMGLISIPMVLGPILGPMLGGWLVSDVSWRAIFYLNVPVGIAALLAAGKVLKRDEPELGERLDVRGLLLLSPGLAALIYGLAQGGQHGDFGAVSALVPTAAGAVLVAGFIAHALTASHPLIDLRLLRRRSVAAGSATMALFMSAYLGSMLLVPLYYQLVRGQSPLHAGLLLIPEGIGALLTMPVGGKLTDSIGPGRVTLAGVVTVTAGMAGFAWLLGATTPYWALSAALLVMGMGMGLTAVGQLGAAIKPLAPDEVPRATTMVNIIGQVSAATGIAAASLLLSANLASQLTAGGHHGPAGGLQAAQHIPPDALARAAGLQADAFQATYWWLPVPLLLLAVIPALILRRSKPAGQAVPPDAV